MNKVESIQYAIDHMMDENFAYELGDSIQQAILDDVCAPEKIARYILTVFKDHPELYVQLNELFSAIIGWDLQSLVNRTKELLDHREER